MFGFSKAYRFMRGCRMTAQRWMEMNIRVARKTKQTRASNHGQLKDHHQIKPRALKTSYRSAVFGCRRLHTSSEEDTGGSTTECFPILEASKVYDTCDRGR